MVPKSASFKESLSSSLNTLVPVCVDKCSVPWVESVVERLPLRDSPSTNCTVGGGEGMGEGCARGRPIILLYYYTHAFYMFKFYNNV